MSEPPNIRTHIEDVEDVIIAIGKSFNLQFAPDELGHVSTFKELCDAITAKIELQDADDCTTQQAFYKLREAVTEVTGIEKSAIAVDTKLDLLFPERGRRQKIKQVEAILGFKLDVLESVTLVKILLAIVVVVSIVGMFLNLLAMGLPCLALAWVFGKIAERTANKFSLNTMGEMAEKMTREHYVSSRRNPGRFNRAEIAKQIEQLLIKNLAIDHEFKELAPETIIIDRRRNKLPE